MYFMSVILCGWLVFFSIVAIHSAPFLLLVHSSSFRLIHLLFPLLFLLQFINSFDCVRIDNHNLVVSCWWVSRRSWCLQWCQWLVKSLHTVSNVHSTQTHSHLQCCRPGSSFHQSSFFHASVVLCV